MKKFAERMPKAELHLHIEGTLEPELMFQLASRNQVDLPFRSPAEVRRAYQFSDLQSFLDIYYQGTRVLLRDRDFDGRGSASAEEPPFARGGLKADDIETRWGGNGTYSGQRRAVPAACTEPRF